MELLFHNFFKGKWLFQRTVVGVDQPTLQLSGEAIFTALSDNNHRYDERGSYLLEGQVIGFHQAYIYEIQEPNVCRVFFPDGRFFYELSGSKQMLIHACGQDRYEGHFEILSNQEWQMFWRITGPRKDLSIKTHYHR